MLVQIGNFLNANGSCGNAAGFKLNSLWKIVDMKATKKSITLLHFIAMMIYKGHAMLRLLEPVNMENKLY
uniref:FH2 domain-containing protein n=1 Tax=Parascaris equorum TaxID=6256 RepID=A0A914RLN9_PAREQ